jgi:hypothetical protein
MGPSKEQNSEGIDEFWKHFHILCGFVGYVAVALELFKPDFWEINFWAMLWFGNFSFSQVAVLQLKAGRSGSGRGAELKSGSTLSAKDVLTLILLVTLISTSIILFGENYIESGLGQSIFALVVVGVVYLVTYLVYRKKL